MRCYIILAIIGLINMLPKDASATAGADCTAANVATNCDAKETCESLKCRVKVGEACSAAADCVANANCATNCACNDGYTPSQNKDACNGVPGVVASLVLLLASVVTSRFM